MSVKGRIYRTQGLIQCDRWRKKSVSRLGDVVKPGWKYKEDEFSFGYSHLEEAVNYLGEDRKIQWVKTEMKKLLGEADMLMWPTGHQPATYNFYIQEGLSAHSPHAQMKHFSCLLVATQSPPAHNNHISKNLS